MSREITSAEVRKHKNSKSIWIIIHNEVYDLTAFLNEHPGGADSLLEYAGQDGTQAFEDVGHSNEARSLMTRFKIGDLAMAERERLVNDCCATISKRKHRKKKSSSPGSSRSDSKCCGPSSPDKCNLERVRAIVIPRSEDGESGSPTPKTSRHGSRKDIPSRSATPKTSNVRNSGRTYDGSSSKSYEIEEPGPKVKFDPEALPMERVKTIVVPNADRVRQRKSNKLKWILLALAGALVVGIVVKKYGMKS